MPKFQFTELATDSDKITARLGAGTGAANFVDDKEVGKIVKFVGDSRYDLAAAGDPIEGFVMSLEPAIADNYSYGTVQKGGRKEVICDGVQATPGTGAIAIGDYVVCGTVVAKGTALADTKRPKVCKATMQPGITEAAAVGDVNDQIKVALQPWRVVAFLSGNGAVGDVALIERVR